MLRLVVLDKKARRIRSDIRLDQSPCYPEDLNCLFWTLGMRVSEVERLCAGWDTCPVSIDRSPISEDRELYLRRLLADASRLFAADHTHVELMRLKRDGEGELTPFKRKLALM